MTITLTWNHHYIPSNHKPITLNLFSIIFFKYIQKGISHDCSCEDCYDGESQVRMIQRRPLKMRLAQTKIHRFHQYIKVIRHENPVVRAFRGNRDAPRDTKVHI